MFARRKGRAGEQELARMIRESLGDITDAERNTFQSRAGGYDLILRGLPLAVEVKRVETPAWTSWLRQAREQAGRFLPVVARRANHQEWEFVFGPLTGAEFCHLVRAIHHYRAAGFPGLAKADTVLTLEGPVSGEQLQNR
jgi:hypothetical protein